MSTAVLSSNRFLFVFVQGHGGLTLTLLVVIHVLAHNWTEHILRTLRTALQLALGTEGVITLCLILLAGNIVALSTTVAQSVPPQEISSPIGK